MSNGEYVWGKAFSDLVKSMPQIVYEIDREYKIRFLNSKGLETLNYSEDEIQGLYAFQFFHSSDHSRLKDNIKRISAGEKIEGNEYTAQRRDGSTFPVVTYSSPIIVGGRVIGLRGIAVDITDRKRLEEMIRVHSENMEGLLKERELKLEELEGSYRDLVENSPNAISVTVDSVIVYVNQKRVELTGHETKADLLGVSGLSGVSLPDREVLSNRDKLRRRGEKLSNITEFTLLKLDGSPVYVTDYNSEIVWEGQNAVMHILVDVTELKQAEEDLKASEEWNRAIFEGSRDAVFIVDEDSRFVDVNSAASGLTGYSREELLTMRIPDLHDYVDLNAYKENYSKIMNGIPMVSEAYILRKDKGKVLTEFNNSKVTIQGKDYMHTSARDVSERKKYQENLDILLEHASQLTSLRSLDDVAEATFRAVEQTLGFAQGSFGVVEGDTLHHTLIPGYPGRALSMPLDGPGVTVKAVRKGETVLVNDVREALDYYPGVEQGMNVRSELVVPVKVNTKPVAVINVESNEVNAFSVDIARLIEILAMHVSSAFINIGEMKRREAYTRRLEALHRSSTLLGEAKTKGAVYDIVQGVMKEDFDFAWTGVGVVQGSSLRYIRTSHPFINEPCISLDSKSVAVRAIRTGVTQHVPDVRLDPDYVMGGQENISSELAVPVAVNGKVVLVLNLECVELNGFTENDVKLMELLATYTGLALLNIWSSEKRLVYERQLKTVGEEMASVNTCRSFEEIAEVTLSIVEDVIAVPLSVFLKVEEDRLVAVNMRGSEIKGNGYPLSSICVTTKAVLEDRVILVEDTRLCSFYVEARPGILSELVVPIKVNENVVGLILMDSHEVGYFNENHVSLAMMLSSHAASNIERIWKENDEREAQRKIIEERERAEQAKRLEEMKTTFIQTATHEIRTPLTSIKGYTELIQMMFDENTPEQLTQFFEVISRNVVRLEKLTHELLEVQRIESGRMELDKVPFLFREICDQFISELSPMLQRSGQRLELVGGDVWVMGDMDRLLQVMVNLVGNASKFSGDGSVIRIAIEEVNGGIQVNVVDEGVGIRAEDIVKLFKPFPGILVEGVTDGIGLGLSICKGIVELHGGKIWAESGGLGFGATFSFTIPHVAEE